MSYDIAIISHARAALLNEYTLPCLANGGVPTEQVHVFVTPGQETDYKTALDPALYGHLHTGAVGLPQQRNAATQAFPDGHRLVHMDDDITALQRLTPDGKLTPVTNIDSLIRGNFAYLRRTKATAWGIYPVPNAFYMSNHISVGLRFLIGQTIGLINRTNELLTIENKDDYERTLLRYITDGTVQRHDYLAAKAAPGRKTPGGLQTINREAANDRDVHQLTTTYPTLVHPGRQRPDGFKEIKLRDPNRRNPPNHPPLP